MNNTQFIKLIQLVVKKAIKEESKNNELLIRKIIREELILNNSNSIITKSNINEQIPKKVSNKIPNKISKLPNKTTSTLKDLAQIDNNFSDFFDHKDFDTIPSAKKDSISQNDQQSLVENFELPSTNANGVAINYNNISPEIIDNILNKDFTKILKLADKSANTKRRV